MDAIVKYTYAVNADDTVTVTLESLYAAGGIIQHLGYVISGTTQDGTYLEVRDIDTGSGSDVDYFLDTPPEFYLVEIGTTIPHCLWLPPGHLHRRKMPLQPVF